MSAQQRRWRPAWLLGAVIAALSSWAWAQSDDDTFAEYREMFGDDNPADFVVEDGEALWQEVRGPKNASLEGCDLGLGAGVVEGAYAQLPRYFEDTGRVMDLAGRIAHCMVDLQGVDGAELAARPYAGRGEQQTDLELLVTYVAAQSKGMPMQVPQARPEEKQSFELGQQMFAFRGGPYDFGCSTCHRETGKRIRLQALPDLTKPEGAQAAYTNWPAYRISEGLVRTMDWRMRDCARQQRLPELQLGSDISVALQTYLGVMAEGGEVMVPGLKR